MCDESATLLDSEIQAVAAVIWKPDPYVKGKLQLLLQKKDISYNSALGKWVLFGGSVDRKRKRDKTPFDAIRRELKEELQGLRPVTAPLRAVHKITPIVDHTYLDSDGQPVNRRVYQAKLAITTKRIQLDEGAGYSLFSQNELCTYQDRIESGDLTCILCWLRKRRS